MHQDTDAENAASQSRLNETAMLIPRLLLKARTDFIAFLLAISDDESGYILSRMHLFIAGKLNDTVTRKDVPRNYTISVPPQHGKSSLIVRYVAWLVGSYPRLCVALTGFSAELMGQMLRQVTSIMDLPVYQVIFPGVKVKPKDDRWDYKRFTNDAIIYAKPAGSKLTGRRVDILIIDDPHAGRAEAESPTIRNRVVQWAVADCFSRLSPHWRVFVIGTRWHPEDLIGHLTGREYNKRLEMLGNTAMKFEVIKIPAICEDPATDPLGRKAGEVAFPEERDLEFLTSIRGAMTTTEWKSQYQQEPVTSKGGQVNADDFNLISPEEVPWSELTAIGSGWDLAATDKTASDWTVGACGARTKDGRLYIFDQFRKQMQIPKLLPAIEARALAWKDMYGANQLGVEGVGGMVGYYQQLRQMLLGKISVRLKNPPVKGGGKLVRAQNWLALVEAKKCIWYRPPGCGRFWKRWKYSRTGTTMTRWTAYPFFTSFCFSPPAFWSDKPPIKFAIIANFRDYGQKAFSFTFHFSGTNNTSP